MAQKLLEGFFGSSQAGKCMEALQQKGYDRNMASKAMQEAVPSTADYMEKETEGQQDKKLGWFNLFGGHSGWEFLTGAVAGIFRGEGIMGSAKTGGISMVSGHIAECIADRCGVSRAAAGEIAAIATPFIAHYVHEKLQQHGEESGAGHKGRGSEGDAVPNQAYSEEYGGQGDVGGSAPNLACREEYQRKADIGGGEGGQMYAAQGYTAPPAVERGPGHFRGEEYGAGQAFESRPGHHQGGGQQVYEGQGQLGGAPRLHHGHGKEYPIPPEDIKHGEDLEEEEYRRRGQYSEREVR